MSRLPKTLQSTLGRCTATGLQSTSDILPCACVQSSSFSSSALVTSRSTVTARPNTGSLFDVISRISDSTAVATSTTNANSLNIMLGRCRMVIRQKHTVALTKPSALTHTTATTCKQYSQLATAIHTQPPPPSTLSSGLQQQHQSHPIHISASAFPSTPSASTAATSPESSPLFRMNNPASIVRQPASARQSKRRYSPQHFYQNRILDPYVNQAVSPITLRQLVFFGRNMQEDKLLKSANYVRTELPIRLAHRIRDFQNLPFIVGTNPHIELVYDLYWQAFEKLSKVPEIKTLEQNDTFCELVKGLLNDHLVVIPQLALGIMESSKHIPPDQIDKFMNKMLRSRISRRVLAEQHISLTANFNSPNHMMADCGYIGIIYTHCRPRDIVERTALLAAETCRQACGGTIEPPKVLLDGNIDAEFSYIPDHIEYILYELLKNSMRFVMQKGAREHRTGELPPIQITVCEGAQDIVFRISDKGGGIDPEMERHLWSYSQSPARFANFEKVSKMAATVQEQMVSPSRSYNESNRVEDEVEDDGEGIKLPPPPTGSSKSTESTTLRLDRHAPPRTGTKSASYSSFSNASSQRCQTVIDSTQELVAPSKPGHLNRESRQYKDQSMHLGIGLPMSRVYAEYWGGDLKVFTMHGYGTDAYAKFCKFGNIYENFDV
ncbi:hypothetical protein BX616_010019 [Lobosporangium transversale]|uniref:Protein-serine/threonine kinase n=1 Tax=Lobosporangium transversale TaxID=64571 RepID=A0A1Y2GRF3_9FUNG|nr:hypothetical protein BCR41DRAFT_351265 [Lobosporangium transversale]KAF9913459.1 hypothetical protein BX616_010019 [Lobosporangium transversale]ORZ20106.1 hypothetical protein BCR41DRAFT_351265 [Lobosporangium transversale]|eukprot:XP_021882646.1 hypothetical protein BCR41DRAFT_351265 [Lobosporangium transversale]